MKKYITFCLFSFFCVNNIQASSLSNEETPPVVGLGTEEAAHPKSTLPDTERLQDTLNSSHGGSYILGFLGVGYNASKINSQKYKDRSAQFGGIIGHGILQSNRYMGLEAIFNHNRFNKHKGYTRFRRTDTYEIAGRFGKVIRANFLPYIRLGLGIQQNIYRNKDMVTRFKSTLITPGVGVQAFFRKNMLLRVETKHQWTLKTKKKINLEIQKKPKGPSIWGGVGFVF